jgi:hypothetical protein
MTMDSPAGPSPTILAPPGRGGNLDLQGGRGPHERPPGFLDFGVLIEPYACRLRGHPMRGYRVGGIVSGRGRTEMLEEALTVLAATGGAAVVQAAGTDMWTGLRQAVAAWFGRGDEQRQRVELERLDRTAEELQSAQVADAERVRIRQEAAWQARIEGLLEGLGDSERARAAEELRALLQQRAPEGGVSAGRGGLAVGGNTHIQADRGSIAAGVINGEVGIDTPSEPDPSQG